ncbi:hypothetical protein [Geminisphaera colitermitum]|uniref:hypothetical protein n=1 Tax=Geminisphaera colitermitum TaxID=1148786 RepID=UPI0012FF13BB|nr:hypothetical protein [Geminisphaera colitermitum]
MHLARLTLLAFALSLVGCVTPGSLESTKAGARARSAEVFIKKQNYLTLARYWNDNAQKTYDLLSGSQNTFLHTFDGYAEISIVVGGYYMGLIELTRIEDKTTRVSVHAWGRTEDMVREWGSLIRSAPEN